MDSAHAAPDGFQRPSDCAGIVMKQEEKTGAEGSTTFQTIFRALLT